jgi:hypothetical protein
LSEPPLVVWPSLVVSLQTLAIGRAGPRPILFRSHLVWCLCTCLSLLLWSGLLLLSHCKLLQLVELPFGQPSLVWCMCSCLGLLLWSSILLLSGSKLLQLVELAFGQFARPTHPRDKEQNLGTVREERIYDCIEQYFCIHVTWLAAMCVHVHTGRKIPTGSNR